MKRAAAYAFALAAALPSAWGSEADALDASEALLRHVFDHFEPKRAPAAVCLDAYVAADIPVLVERMRGFRPAIRPVSQCHSLGTSTENQSWARLGLPIKEAEGRFLQSIDYDGSRNCVFQIQKAEGSWKISTKLQCIKS